MSDSIIDAIIYVILRVALGVVVICIGVLIMFAIAAAVTMLAGMPLICVVVIPMVLCICYAVGDVFSNDSP